MERVTSMSNIIRFSETSPESERIVMSNQGTDCFLELLIGAADGLNKTENQEKLISFLRDRKAINDISPGTASFDIAEMPWEKETLSEDAAFMMETAGKAKTEGSAGKPGFRPDMRIVSPWLDRFSSMIWKLDKNYIYGGEEEEIVNRGIEAIRSVLLGEDSGAKSRLLFYLDRYLDPYYQNDLSGLHEPLKELLSYLTTSGGADAAEEARHLMEAYMD